MLPTSDLPHDETRDRGEQPLARILSEHKLKAHDVVAASPERMTHKMISRAAKGRWLTPHTKAKVLAAVNAATHKQYGMNEVFNY